MDMCKKKVVKTNATFLKLAITVLVFGLYTASSAKNGTPENVKNKKFTNVVLGDYIYSGPVNGIGMPDGVGVAIFTKKGKPDGRQYKGPFSNGTFTGKEKAEMIMSNGDEFVGTFKGNYFDKGRYTVAATGEYFEGTFSNGDPYVGAWYDKSGNVLKEINVPKRNRRLKEIEKYALL